MSTPQDEDRVWIMDPQVLEDSARDHRDDTPPASPKKSLSVKFSQVPTSSDGESRKASPAVSFDLPGLQTPVEPETQSKTSCTHQRAHLDGPSIVVENFMRVRESIKPAGLPAAAELPKVSESSSSSGSLRSPSESSS